MLQETRIDEARRVWVETHHKTINQFHQLEFLAAIEMFSVIQWLSIDGISVKLLTLEISFG